MKLSEKLNDLLSRLSGAPEGTTRLTIPDVRGELRPLIADAETLEQSQSSAEAKAQIASLQDALEKSKAQKKDLEGLMTAVNQEIDSLRKEKSKREHDEKYPELPREQFWILEVLPTESQVGHLVRDVSEKADLPQNEAEVHLHHLRDLKPRLADHTFGHAASHWWFCTIAGTKYLMAMRSGEEHLRYKRSPRMDDQNEKVLRALSKIKGSASATTIDMLVRGASSHVTSESMKGRLRILVHGLLVSTDDEGKTWKLTQKGLDYLGEHRGLRKA